MQEIPHPAEGADLRFPQPLVRARFLRREKRFFIYAAGDDGTGIVAHTNNTGRMSGCLFPDATIWLSPAENPARKLKWTLEIVETPAGVPVGVNTGLANRLVADAVVAGLIPDLAGSTDLRREVRYDSGASRVDILLESGPERVWIEVKNVSLVEDGHGRFPDAPTERGRKHLRELMAVVAGGDRAAMVFCSQRPDARTVGAADDIDPEYGNLLREAAQAGVEVYGLGCLVSPEAVIVDRVLAIDMRPFPHR